jgi:hypothetical protein
VSSIKSKDTETVNMVKAREKCFWIAIDFNLQPTTTMTTPHKLVKLEGASYFIGKCRAGDYVKVVQKQQFIKGSKPSGYYNG